jgi:hypothetical protein
VTYRTADPEADAENYYWRMEHTCACGREALSETRCANRCGSRMCSECVAGCGRGVKPICRDCAPDEDEEES